MLVKRIILPVLTAALLALGLSAPASAQGGQQRDEGGTLLALGDSVPFGYNPLLVPGQFTKPDPTVFVGYPEVVAQKLDLKDVNASCPGQTSGSFSSLQAPDNGCFLYRFGFHLPLHVNYSGTQLQFAINYLVSHHDVKLVTMTLGANDVFLLQKRCATDPNPAVCLSNGLPAVQKQIDDNLKYIFGQLRNVAHYQGRLVTLTYYSLAYDPVSAAGVHSLNKPIVDATRDFDGIIASGFGAFRPAALATPDKSSCTAGLLIKLPTGACDVHPSPAGRDLLAAAVIRALEHAGDQGDRRAGGSRQD